MNKRTAWKIYQEYRDELAAYQLKHIETQKVSK